MKMTIENFDRLCYSTDPFDNNTADFVGMFTWITDAWEQGESTLPCEWYWKNPILKEMAGVEDEPYLDYDDETFYNPYMGCDDYDSFTSGFFGTDDF